MTCPVVAPDWCHFSQRLARSRDQMLAKNARVPFEDERYCWIAVSRRHHSATHGKARILAEPIRTKAQIALKLCTPEGLEQRVVPKRDHQAYPKMRRRVWEMSSDARGDALVLGLCCQLQRREGHCPYCP